MILMKSIGGADAFLFYEQRMQNITTVASAADLAFDWAVRNLVNYLLALPKVTVEQQVVN